VLNNKFNSKIKYGKEVKNILCKNKYQGYHLAKLRSPVILICTTELPHNCSHNGLFLAQSIPYNPQPMTSFTANTASLNGQHKHFHDIGVQLVKSTNKSPHLRKLLTHFIKSITRANHDVHQRKSGHLPIILLGLVGKTLKHDKCAKPHTQVTTYTNMGNQRLSTSPT